LITQLESLTYLKLFLTIAAGVDRPEFNPYNVLVLDILYLIFRGVKPRELSQNQDRVSLHFAIPSPTSTRQLS
jgi:replication fork protection complex subunit Tof1/Swi1